MNVYRYAPCANHLSRSLRYALTSVLTVAYARILAEKDRWKKTFKHKFAFVYIYAHSDIYAEVVRLTVNVEFRACFLQPG